MQQGGPIRRACLGPPESPAHQSHQPKRPPRSQVPRNPRSVPRCSQSPRLGLDSRPDPHRDKVDQRPAEPNRNPLTPHHSAPRRSAPQTPRHTMNSIRGCLRTPDLDECFGALGPLCGLTNRWHPHASSSARRPSRQSLGAWSRSSNGGGSKGGSLSMRLSLRVALGSSAPGSTRMRSSLVPSSSAVGRSLGFASIRRSRRGCCGGWARDRRLTRPPAQVSGRASLRAAEGARCGCFRSVDGGRTTHPLRLR